MISSIKQLQLFSYSVKIGVVINSDFLNEIESPLKAAQKVEDYFKIR